MSDKRVSLNVRHFGIWQSKKLVNVELKKHWRYHNGNRGALKLYVLREKGCHGGIRPRCSTQRSRAPLGLRYPKHRCRAGCQVHCGSECSVRTAGAASC